ncbi:gasdermin-B [Orycteropus afer afer]|uniref:Gasdermin-B n=1 Tax=Orycteropus afer afer TaxID=1230840 RepID=A0AC54ZAW7_ORYAF|nr:gasdermin-B [Orycteropus afer afer]
MPSVFEGITKTVVQELDSGGDMIAVRSVIDADRFNCFYLVREKKTLLGLQFHKTGLTLKDILETEEGEKLTDELDSGSSGQRTEFRISDCVDSKAEIKVKLPKAITVTGMAGRSQETHGHEMKLLVNQISQQQLEALGNRKLKKKLPPTIKSIGDRKENLYLVTEALVTAQEATLKNEQQFTFLSLIDWSKLSFKHKVSEVVISGELQTEDPASPLIASLFNDAGILVEARAEAIQELLDALMELPEEYQQLVLEGLEKGILSLLGQVESALENCSEQYSNPHDMGCDSETQSLCALYVALSILLQLAEKPTS